jgi:hypothetical protein
MKRPAQRESTLLATSEEPAAKSRDRRQCHDRDCKKRGTYSNETKTIWACATHGLEDMVSELGRPFVPKSRASTQSAEDTSSSSFPSTSPCMQPGCAKTASFFNIDKTFWTCQRHGYKGLRSRNTGKLWHSKTPIRRKQVAREDADGGPTDGDEAADAKAGGETIIADKPKDETKRVRASSSRTAFSGSGTVKHKFEKVAPADEELNEDRIIKALMQQPPDIRIVTTTGVIETQRAVVNRHFGLSPSEASVTVEYPKDVVQPVVNWMFKEAYLQPELQVHPRVIQMLNLANKYPMPRLQVRLREFLTGISYDLAVVKLLIASEDPIVKEFMCSMLAKKRLELSAAAREAKCLNDPRQKSGGKELYLCCSDDAGRLSTGVTYEGAYTCSHYTARPSTAEPGPPAKKVVRWCCTHGRTPSPEAEKMSEILKLLSHELRDSVDKKMM